MPVNQNPSDRTVTPGPALSLEPMSLPDLDQVLAIEKASFPSPWSRESFRHEIDNHRAFTLVARSGPVVKGYLVGWQVVDEFHIGNIAVRQDYRQQGIGSLLLSRLCRWVALQQCTLVSLEVRDSNDQAKKLYIKFGFVPVALRRHYYQDTGENAVIMIKNLRPIPSSPEPEGNLR